MNVPNLRHGIRNRLRMEPDDQGEKLGRSESKRGSQGKGFSYRYFWPW